MDANVMDLTMTNDFEIIALNGVTGECLTTDDEATQDDWCQRLKETPLDPLEDIRQEHEAFLTQLEALAVEAIVTNDWTPVLEHLNEIMAWQDGKLHEAQKPKASADELHSPSASHSQRPTFNRKD
jgi:hypothetical protein